MIVGLGMDVVEVARIQRILGGDPALAGRFLARCFSPAERAYCDPARDRATRYAARFAAKEAASKALGAPVGISWHDVEVARGEGPPSLVLRGIAAEAARKIGAARVHVTLTHDAGVAAATVILEAALPPEPRSAGRRTPPKPRSAGRRTSPKPRSAGRRKSGDKP